MAEVRQDAFVVLHPFGVYTKGQIITDPVELAAIRQSGQMTFVVTTQILAAQSGSAPAKREA